MYHLILIFSLAFSFPKLLCLFPDLAWVSWVEAERELRSPKVKNSYVLLRRSIHEFHPRSLCHPFIIKYSIHFQILLRLENIYFSFKIIGLNIQPWDAIPSVGSCQGYQKLYLFVYLFRSKIKPKISAFLYIFYSLFKWLKLCFSRLVPPDIWYFQEQN